MKKVDFLRKKYPRFVYENFGWEISGKDLKISFDFRIPPQIKFRPKLIIKNVKKYQIKKIGPVPQQAGYGVKDRVIDNFVFHLGLIELLSYWKATCSPEVLVKAGYLNNEQIRWWKNLIDRGMGQFFYENKINFLKPDFIKIISTGDFYDRRNRQQGGSLNQSVINEAGPRREILVPVGGGKDSIVTLEILKHAKSARSAKVSRNANAPMQIVCFSLNPTRAAKKIMKIACCKNSIIVERKIDRKLLKLNRQGFLNGHTPFSAYLAFLSVLSAVLFDQKYIAFSNERSSNEGNVRYLGRMINHQYSKSFDFEQKFRKYSKKYLAQNVEYFSFLRPLYEIQIAKLFSRYPKYFNTFLSCNVAYQTKSRTKKPNKKWCGTPNQNEVRFGTSPAPCRIRRLWCGDCPKCLFVFAILYPFIDKKKLIKIFGQNLFEKRRLLPLMLELMGERKFKPFECVGTKKESLIAFYLAFRSFKRRRVKLPFLLSYFEKKILPKYPNLEKESKELLNSWSNQHNLSKEFEKILKNSQH